MQWVAVTKAVKILDKTFMAHCNVMIDQQVTLSGDAEWPKVADAVIEAFLSWFARGWVPPHESGYQLNPTATLA